MINTLPGNIGHLLVIASFVSAVLVTIGYFITTNLPQTAAYLPKREQWFRFSRAIFAVHALTILGVVMALFYIIYNHLYEYHYAWNHSSNNLPIHYMISCFWEGQEGSFLLWMFWHALLGAILIVTNKSWEAPVMAIFMAVQAFLCSMILGIVVFGIKIGSDPFILLRDAMPHIPVFQEGSPNYNPNFVPEDGTGLNPLLQNYWMVIHPPTLFLGFATTLIPFAYCMAGLWQKRFKEWVRPALPWALFSGAILGLGILMGGYWAYETLNFGGYWNWDPVENAVFVPWLVLVASIHMMIVFKKNSTALKTAIILVISTFILILYSTFLTRSGILGNASVHSFTDLGLSGQLLLYLLSFTLLSIALVVWRWKAMPVAKQEVSTYTREFWIFMGATVLCLASFQVLWTTSIPVFNSIVEAFGSVSNLALPADQIEHYTKFQLWTGVLIAVFSGTGQFFFWKKMDREQLLNALTFPLIITLLASAAWIALGSVQNWKFIVLLTTSVYSITANLFILTSLLRRKNFKLTGGSIAHIGVAMMLLGIMFSSGYSSIVSKNNSGLLLFDPENLDEGFTSENENNVLLWLNRPIKMKDYQVTYRGDYIESPDFPDYIRKRDLVPIEDPFQAVTLEKLSYEEKTYYERGDTLRIYPENTYYRVEYRDESGRVFALYPRAQVNPNMGLIASPDIRRGLKSDLYTHVSSIPDPSQEKEWSETEEHQVSPQDTFFLNDYVAIFEGVQRMASDELIQLTSNDAGVEAKIRVLAKDREIAMHPKFVIKDSRFARIPDVSDELGLRITLLNINPDEGKFTFGVNTTQKDYIIMKALEKPLINVLWLGTLVLMLGFSVAIYRRYSEFSKMRNKGME